MSGILYGVGVGPGDPELMTLKAVKIIKQCDIIAVPGTDYTKAVSYKIAKEAVPEIIDKKVISLDMPMTTDSDALVEKWNTATNTLVHYLERKKDVAFLTLGDVAVYSTFMYIERIIKESGFQTLMVNGIPSFCAAASRLGVALCEWDEPLHIYPARHNMPKDLSEGDNYVFMKAGKSINEIAEIARNDSRNLYVIENCGMYNECTYENDTNLSDDMGYFTTAIVK